MNNNKLMKKKLKPLRCNKAPFYIRENRPNFPTTDGFRSKISMKLFYKYMAIFFTLSPTSNHLHPLQDENCDSNSRLVVDEDDNGKFRVERFKGNLNCDLCWYVHIDNENKVHSIGYQEVCASAKLTSSLEYLLVQDYKTSH